MLIWQGAGIGAALIPAILGFIAQWTVDHYFGHGYAMTHGWQNSIAWSIGAGIVWVGGVRLATQPGKILIDPATGNDVELKEKHTLFWIPMQYWAIVWACASVVSIVKEFL
jgi:hypothetical protein